MELVGQSVGLSVCLSVSQSVMEAKKMSTARNIFV
jgi:hypothetical protein